jgi:hypothetical protein
MPLQDLSQSIGYLGQGFVPAQCHRLAVPSLQRAYQPLVVVLVIGNLETLTADIALGSRVCFITSNFKDAIIFDHHLQSTALEAETTTGLLPWHDLNLTFFRF